MSHYIPDWGLVARVLCMISTVLHNEHNSLHRLKPRKFALPIALITSNMLTYTEDVAPETKDCNLGRFGSGSSGCLVHSELAAVGSKNERISASRQTRMSRRG